MQRVSSELRLARAEGEALVARKGKLSAHDEEGNAKLEAKLAEVVIAEGALEAKLARHRSTGLPKWRASMAEACRTIGMDAAGFALEEGFDPTAQAWPRFVPVIRLSRHRGLTRGVAYALKYQQEHAGFEVALEDVVATPMEVHRQLQVQYQRLQMQGLLHDKIMAQLSDLCGLPVAWKGCTPFIGSFDEGKLRLAWLVNILLLLGIVALLLWDVLAFYGEMPMRMVAGTMAAGEGVGLVLALLVPLAIRSVLNALHGRDARRRTSKAEEKATAAAQEALPTEAVLRRQRKVAAAAHSKISMLALKEASTTHFGSHFGGKALIEAALEESADRYKVARHILRRDHRHQRAEAALQQAFGSTMDKSDEGLEAAFAKVDEDSSGQISDAEMRGYIVSMFDGTIDEETITQMLKAADADGDGEVSLDEFKTIMRAGPDVKEEGGGGTLSEQLERNRAQEDAALAALAVDEQVKAEELDALRDVPQRSMRHRAVDSIMARKQMSKRDVAREKAEHLAELSGRSTETARAIVEAQAAAQLALIAADDPDEIEMCQLEEGAKTKSAEELHAKLAALGVEVSHKIADDLEALIELLVRTRHAKLVAKARKRAARRALAKQGSLPPVPEGACKGRLRVYLVSATGLIAADAGGKSDPYVRLRVGACSEKSEVIKNTLEPVWEQKIEFTGELTEFFDTGLLLEVFDWDRFSGDDSLGSVQISLEEELRPDRILEDGAGWPIEEDLSLKGSIRLRVAWRPENEVLVTSVDKRGAAHGLLLRGDTIVAINYTRVTDEAQARALGGAAVGEVTYSVLRLNAEANRHELHLLTVEKPEVAVPLGIAMKDLSNKPEEPETPESWVKEQQVLFAMKVRLTPTHAIHTRHTHATRTIETIPTERQYW